MEIVTTGTVLLFWIIVNALLVAAFVRQRRRIAARRAQLTEDREAAVEEAARRKMAAAGTEGPEARSDALSEAAAEYDAPPHQRFSFNRPEAGPASAEVARFMADANRQSPLRRVAGMVALVFVVVVWTLVGAQPLTMEASIATSNLTIHSSEIATDDAGNRSLVLHLHLDSTVPQIWPIYLLLDGADPATYGFSDVVDFSSGADQIATIPQPATGPLLDTSGPHKLAYGYESFAAANHAHNTWQHGQFWLISSSRALEFAMPE